MNNRKKFFWDVIQNTLAFGVYIGTFHLIMMPYLARTLAVSINAQLLMYIMFANILTMSMGNELGILYQILAGRTLEGNHESDLLRLLNWTNGFLILFMGTVLTTLGFPFVVTLFLTLTTVFTNIRFYIQGYLRFAKDFKTIGFGNLWYLLGVLLSIGVFQFTTILYWIVLFLAEGFSTVYLFVKAKKHLLVSAPKSETFGQSRKEYVELIGATLLTNIPTYADKLLVLPLLGDVTMSAYYAGTVLSKMLFLVINPINGVLLSWLSSDQTTNEKKVIARQLKANSVVLILVFFLSVPMIYVMMLIFYPQFLNQVIPILLPLAAISSFSIASSLLRVVFLRYFNLMALKYINILHIFTFLIASLLGAKYFGLIGFTYGVGFSKFVLWLSFFWILTKKPLFGNLVHKNKDMF